jgi:hypothetical protein
MSAERSNLDVEELLFQADADRIKQEAEAVSAEADRVEQERQQSYEANKSYKSLSAELDALSDRLSSIAVKRRRLLENKGKLQASGHGEEYESILESLNQEEAEINVVWDRIEPQVETFRQQRDRETSVPAGALRDELQDRANLEDLRDHHLNLKYQRAEEVNALLTKLGVQEQVPEDYNSHELFRKIYRLARTVGSESFSLEEFSQGIDQCGREIAAFLGAFDSVHLTDDQREVANKDLVKVQNNIFDVYMNFLDAMRFSEVREVLHQQQDFLNSLPAIQRLEARGAEALWIVD